MAVAIGRGDATVSRNLARSLYYRARVNAWLGRGERARALCEAALGCGDYSKAHKLLSALELPGEDYFRLLARIHAYLRPRTYVEIGVDQGRSFEIVGADTLTLGIDPNPRIRRPLTPRQKVYAQTSDDFFASHDVRAELGGQAVELAFIDGMHQMEFALRDFINLERCCTPRSIILIHDVYPIDAKSAARERQSSFWSGDIWRLILILKKHRPDLLLHTIGTGPTGLALVQKLDPSSTHLGSHYQQVVEEVMALDLSALDGRKKQMLNFLPNDWAAIRAQLDRSAAL